MTDLSMEELASRIGENLAIVHEKIDHAARMANRRGEDVRLVLVTKAQPVELMLAAYQAGARTFGENYPEQAAPKIDAMRACTGIEWHMIGHIQGRKANLVAQYFDYVHSIDSLKIANRLARLAREQGRTLPVLLELNVGGEESKSGWRVETNDELDAFLPEIESIAAMPNLSIRGLMTMPPFFIQNEYVRPYFRKLRSYLELLDKRVPGPIWRELSMGTSSDYWIAVEEGATMVRVGQAVLGSRPEPREK